MDIWPLNCPCCCGTRTLSPLHCSAPVHASHHGLVILARITQLLSRAMLVLYSRGHVKQCLGVAGALGACRQRRRTPHDKNMNLGHTVRPITRMTPTSGALRDGPR